MLVEESGGDVTEAKGYYQSFLDQAGPGNAYLIRYLNERIKIINEKLFMEGRLD